MRKLFSLVLSLLLLPAMAWGQTSDFGLTIKNAEGKTTTTFLPGDSVTLQVDDNAPSITADKVTWKLQQNGGDVPFLTDASQFGVLEIKEESTLVHKATIGSASQEPDQVYTIVATVQTPNKNYTLSKNITVKGLRVLLGVPQGSVGSLPFIADNNARQAFTLRAQIIPPDSVPSGTQPQFRWSAKHIADGSAVAPVPLYAPCTATDAQTQCTITTNLADFAEDENTGGVQAGKYTITVEVTNVLDVPLRATYRVQYLDSTYMQIRSPNAIAKATAGADPYKWIGDVWRDNNYVFSATGAPNTSGVSYLWVMRTADMASEPISVFPLDQDEIDNDYVFWNDATGAAAIQSTATGDFAPFHALAARPGNEGMVPAGDYRLQLLVLDRLSAAQIKEFKAGDLDLDVKNLLVLNEGSATDEVYYRKISASNALRVQISAPRAEIAFDGTVGTKKLVLGTTDNLFVTADVQTEGADFTDVDSIVWDAKLGTGSNICESVGDVCVIQIPESIGVGTYPVSAEVTLDGVSETLTAIGQIEIQIDCDDPATAARYPNACFAPGSGFSGRKGEEIYEGRCVTNTNQDAIGWYENGTAMELPIPPLRAGTDSTEFHWCFCYERPVAVEQDGITVTKKRLEWYKTILEPINDSTGQQSTIVTAQKVNYCVALAECIGDTCVIGAQDGWGLFTEMIRTVYSYGANVIGAIVLLIIVISGVQMIIAGASAESYGAAKDRILQAVLSMLLLFSTAMILNAVAPDFFSASEDGSPADTDQDGMPDWWERDNGLDEIDPSDSGASLGSAASTQLCDDLDSATQEQREAIDPDGDGSCNYYEFIRGTNPKFKNEDPVPQAAAQSIGAAPGADTTTPPANLPTLPPAPVVPNPTPPPANTPPASNENELRELLQEIRQILSDARIKAQKAQKMYTSLNTEIKRSEVSLNFADNELYYEQNSGRKQKLEQGMSTLVNEKRAAEQLLQSQADVHTSLLSSISANWSDTQSIENMTDTSAAVSMARGLLLTAQNNKSQSKIALQTYAPLQQMEQQLILFRTQLDSL